MRAGAAGRLRAGRRPRRARAPRRQPDDRARVSGRFYYAARNHVRLVEKLALLGAPHWARRGSSAGTSATLWPRTRVPGWAPFAPCSTASGTRATAASARRRGDGRRCGPLQGDLSLESRAGAEMEGAGVCPAASSSDWPFSRRRSASPRWDCIVSSKATASTTPNSRDRSWPGIGPGSRTRTGRTCGRASSRPSAGRRGSTWWRRALRLSRLGLLLVPATAALATRARWADPGSWPASSAPSIPG